MDYKTLKKTIAGGCPLTAENENGEFVLVEEGKENGEHFYRTQTLQNNGWTRTNVYWEDGTTEELYEKTGGGDNCMTDNKYWIFLENLRRSGETNMFGAVPYLEKAFGLSHKEAAKILGDWMKNYNPDDYKEET